MLGRLRKNELEIFRQAEWIEPQNRFVFWSGGKDSTVALHLALRAWQDVNVVFVDTGITLPETLDYIRELTEKWNLNLTVLKPKIDFWNYVAKNGFPNIKALWCRRLLKLEPIKEFMKKQHGWKVQVLGIRKAESNVRRKSEYYQEPFVRDRRFSLTYNLLPILEWSDQQVDKYIHKFKIPINPAYKIYSTSGCYFCPFVRNSRHYLALKYNHPELFKKIVKAEKVMRKGKTPWAGKSIIPITDQQFLEVGFL